VIFKRLDEKQPLRTKLYGKQEFFFFPHPYGRDTPGKNAELCSVRTFQIQKQELFKSKNRKKLAFLAKAGYN